MHRQECQREVVVEYRSGSGAAQNCLAAQIVLKLLRNLDTFFLIIPMETIRFMNLGRSSSLSESRLGDRAMRCA